MNVTKSRTFLVCVPVIFLGLTVRLPAQTYTNFTTIDDPLATKSSLYGTHVQGIAGNIVVGYYSDSTGQHGFFHTLGTTNYTTLDDPAGFRNGSSGTAAYGISGENIIGFYQDEIGSSGTYGFVYNLSTGTYTTLNNPAGVNEGISSTEAFGIDGNNIIGNVSDNGLPAGNVLGFLASPVAGQTGQYSYSAFYIPIPGRINSTTNYLTRPYGISGENVVGTFEDTNGYNPGFIYNLNTQSLTILTNAAGAYVWPNGIEGSNVVGYFSDPNSSYNDSGFLYVMGTTNWTTIRDPLAVGNTFAEGISGQAIVGNYYDSSAVPHGFVVGKPTLPAVLPIITAFYLVSRDFTMNASNGIPGAPYAILATTNLALPLTQWTTIETNSFDSNGGFMVTKALNPAIPFTFYIVQESP
jgi:hypothetical protein